MAVKEIGALVAMEARWPRGSIGMRCSAIERVTSAIMRSDLAGETARLSFEPDKVEWIVLVTPEQLGSSIWQSLDRLLAGIVRAACEEAA